MARNTRERILVGALALYNASGEPNITTNAIAEAIEISPGNLHYHFPKKADITWSLFEAFEQRMLAILAVPPDRCSNLEDIWLLLHLNFELIGDYQFIYRDLTDLCSHHPKIHKRFLGLLRLLQETYLIMLEDLAADEVLMAGRQKQAELVESMVFMTTFWLAYDRITKTDHTIDPQQAVMRVFQLLEPFLAPEARATISGLSAGYE